MKTLSKKQTAKFFNENHTYEDFDKLWKRLTTDKKTKVTLTATDYLLANAIRGRDWTLGFTVFSNKNKVANGYEYDWGAYKAVSELRNIASDIRYIRDGGVFVEHAKRRVGRFLNRFNGTITYHALASLADILPNPTTVLIDREKVEPFVIRQTVSLAKRIKEPFLIERKPKTLVQKVLEFFQR